MFSMRIDPFDPQFQDLYVAYRHFVDNVEGDVANGAADEVASKMYAYGRDHGIELVAVWEELWQTYSVLRLVTTKRTATLVNSMNAALSLYQLSQWRKHES